MHDQLRIKFIVCLFIFFSVCKVLGQTRLKIISGTDHSGLPYTTIANLSQHQIYSTNELGEIQLNAISGDTIQISYVGYKKTNYINEGLNEKTIVLDQNELILQNVSVSNCKKIKKLTINNFVKEKEPRSFRGFMMGSGKISEKGKFAMLLKSPKPLSHLKKISFWLIKYLGCPDSSVLNPFIITLYDVDAPNDLPGPLLTTAPIFYFPKHDGKQTIDLEKLHIRIPEKGIYVGFQLIIEEKYKWKQHFTSYMGSGDTTVTLYGGIIDGLHNSTSTIAYYDIENDTWCLNIGSHMEIKYEAVLDYCDE